MTRDTSFPSPFATGENPPLTRKEMRERERQAQQAAHKQHSSKHPVEAPAVPVLADLFTPHSDATAAEVPAAAVAAAATAAAAPGPAQATARTVHNEASPVAADVQPVQAQPAASIEPLALPSRRSMRGKQAAEAVPSIPVAPTSAPVAVVPPAALVGAPTVSERLFTAPIATITEAVLEEAADAEVASIRADAPLDIFGLMPTTVQSVASPATTASTPTVTYEAAPTTRKRAKVGKSTRTPKQAAAATAPRTRKATGSEVRSKRVWVTQKALAPSGTSRPTAKRAASKALTFAAMLFAGAILVGGTVPSNVFMDADAAVVAAAPEGDLAALAANVRSTQSLAVSEDVQSEVAAHDDIKVISYAEVLALKYAGVDYEYRATTGAIRWPFPYAIPITDGFGYRSSGFHKGTDFAAASGTPIYAIADGTVELIQADWSGYGYHAVISHVINGQQVTSLYAHMITDSSPIVVGQQIKAGDFLGLVGETGIAYGAHLHFEIHLDDVPVDPYAWLTANAVN
ncbi:M23 family metallopeptidase [Rhodoglobus sp. NPDC076762]